MGALYDMVKGVHTLLPTTDGVPSLKALDTAYLDEVRRGLVGARMSVGRLEQSVSDELRGRGFRLEPVIPIRAEDPDPDKNKEDL